MAPEQGGPEDGEEAVSAEAKVAKLRQVEVLQSQGMAAADAISQIGVSEVSCYRWRKEHGGMGADQLKRRGYMG